MTRVPPLPVSSPVYPSPSLWQPLHLDSWLPPSVLILPLLPGPVPSFCSKCLLSELSPSTSSLPVHQDWGQDGPLSLQLTDGRERLQPHLSVGPFFFLFLTPCWSSSCSYLVPAAPAYEWRASHSMWRLERPSEGRGPSQVSGLEAGVERGLPFV